MDSKTKISSIYKPTAKELFMNPKQKEYFKRYEVLWKMQLFTILIKSYLKKIMTSSDLNPFLCRKKLLALMYFLYFF